MDWVDTGIGAAISAGLLGLGYLIKRWVEGAPNREAATLYSDLTDLMLKLRAAGLSIEEVRDFDAALRSRVRQASAAPETRESLQESEPDQYWSQAEMNGRAFAALDVADAQLQQAILELNGFLNEAERALLEQSQDAWRAHREAEAELAAAEYDGGSIQPLIRTTEMSAVSEDRLKRVRAMIEERRAHLGR